MADERRDRSRSGTIPPEPRPDANLRPEPGESPPRETGPRPPTSRRSFLWKAWMSLALVGVAEALWVIVDFLRPGPARSEAGAGVLTAGPLDAFEPGSVTAFPQGKLYLVRLQDGGFLAVSRECTHLGCTVPWIQEENRFVCPCHASGFNIRGEVVNPPAPRALDIFEVRIENRIVKVNTSNLRRRDAFDPTQVTHP